uniref:Uncharacterized protein n=2 Tax=Eutreptiella gymnastica TaxID=73025 RepID=A0A7S1N8R9_9EUGL|mmetsp:Transcript_139356/g.242317  ORF Transcript_139356/g.242317 Transcript_139356/m.242317 type:complete len:158 (+) Transcript_139356:394-867(+)
MGIVACIVGSFYIGLYLGYACLPQWQWFYMALITVEVVPLLYIVSQEKLRKKQKVVVPFFVAVVATGLVPAMHFTLFVDHPLRLTMMQAIYSMFGLYLLGVLFYLLEIPESWYPGRFDYILHSHQVWHMFVFMAPLCEYLGALVVMSHGPLGPLCPT